MTDGRSKTFGISPRRRLREKKLLSFIDTMFNIVQHVHALPRVPTHPAAPVSGAQLCFRYRRIARLVRIVSFRSNRFFSAPK